MPASAYMRIYAYKMLPRPSQNPPKTLPKHSPNPPKTLPKPSPNRPQIAFSLERGFETQFSLPKAPKTRPRTPKTRPRGPQESPRAPQEAPKRLQNAAQEAPEQKITVFLGVRVKDLRLQRPWRPFLYVFLRFSRRRLLENIEKTIVFPRFFRCCAKNEF